MFLNNVSVPGWVLVILSFVVYGLQLCSVEVIFVPASQKGRTRSIEHRRVLRLEGLNNKNYFLIVLVPRYPRLRCQLVWFLWGLSLSLSDGHFLWLCRLMVSLLCSAALVFLCVFKFPLLMTLD